MIRYREYGPGAGAAATTVVLPGLSVSWYLRRACSALAARTGRRVLLVQPPGFGSPLPGRPTVARVAEALLPWLRGLGPVSLLGQSNGCLLAACLAPRAEVTELHLVGPVVDPELRTVPAVARAWLADGRNEPWYTVLLEAPEWALHVRNIWPYLRSSLDIRLEDVLADVTCPVTIVRGGSDPLSSHQWAASLADAPGRRLVTVPGGAHTFMVGNPGLLAGAL